MSLTVSPARRRRVPVEHRTFGLDKRSFPYAIFVIAVFVVATVVIPIVNSAIKWDDPVRAGQQLALADGIQFTPVTGWNVEKGYRTRDGAPATQKGEATVTNDGVTFDVMPDSFNGTPAQLLDQIAKVTSSTGDPTFRVDGDPATVTTPAGDVGVIQSYSSVRGDGLIAAFVINGTGLKVTAYGNPTQMQAATEDIHDMIASIRTTDPAGSAA